MIEKFELMVDSEIFLIEHDGTKSWKDQKDFKSNLIQSIREIGKKEGFIPYNNFESSIRYKLARKPDMSKDQYKLLHWYPTLPDDWEEGMTVGYGDRTQELAPTSAKYTQRWIPGREVKGYPGHWERVVEPRFKVLEYSKGTLKSPTVITVLSEGPLKLKRGERVWTEPNPLNYRIHTIKRTKDNNIFSIGDYVGNEKASGYIQELSVNPSNGTYLDVWYGHGPVPLEFIESKRRAVDIDVLKDTIRKHMEACIQELEQLDETLK